MVEHPGLLLTKGMLLDAVWPGLAVSDSLPATCVAELRTLLGDDARTPKFIETVHRRGYRFIAEVTAPPTDPEPTRPMPCVPNGQKSMVGREKELARLQDLYGQVLEGQRLVLFVTGEAGIGKTTFVQAFLDAIARAGSTRIGRGQCVEQYGSGEPYMPVLEALSRMSREAGSEQLIERLNRFAPTWLAQMPELLTHEERMRLQSETQGVTQQRMLREMTQALEALAQDSPVILFLEDLHWSDFSTLELIAAVARRNDPARLLVIGTYRPVEILASENPLRTMKEELELHGYCKELRLNLLNQQHITRYLSRRFESEGPEQFRAVVPVIHARTEGNPLFMVNIVDYLADSGVLSAASQMGPPPSIDPPRNIRQMIERNLARLEPEEQVVLEGASVAGAEFSAALVAAALERPQDEIEACCSRLSRHEQFVMTQGTVSWPDGTIATAFRFHHALYQEVLYSRLPLGNRLQFHRRIAMREEAGYGDRAGEVATELAHHYSLANVKHKALRYFQLAGERAIARGAMFEAEEQYRCALKVLDELPQVEDRDRLELSLQVALGTVLWTSKSWSHPDTLCAYKRAEELAKGLAADSELIPVLLGLHLSASGGGRFIRSRAIAERMLAAAASGGNPAPLGMAHTFMGEALLEAAQYVAAREHLELGGRYCRQSDFTGLAGWGLLAPALDAIVLLTLGFPDRARKLARETLHMASYRSDPVKVAAMHLWLGILSTMLRDSRGLIESSEAMSRISANEPVWSGLVDFFAGQAQILEGKRKEGASCLHQAQVFCESVGLLGVLSWLRLNLVESLADQGEIEAALLLASEAIIDEEIPHLRPSALRVHGDLLIQANAEASMIEKAYHAAVDCARTQGAKYFELEAATHFARWLKSQSRADEARILLAEVYGWFTEGFDTAALRDANKLLDELSDKHAATRSSGSRS